MPIVLFNVLHMVLVRRMTLNGSNSNGVESWFTKAVFFHRMVGVGHVWAFKVYDVGMGDVCIMMRQ